MARFCLLSRILLSSLLVTEGCGALHPEAELAMGRQWRQKVERGRWRLLTPLDGHPQSFSAESTPAPVRRPTLSCARAASHLPQESRLCQARAAGRWETCSGLLPHTAQHH